MSECDLSKLDILETMWIKGRIQTFAESMERCFLANGDEHGFGWAGHCIICQDRDEAPDCDDYGNAYLNSTPLPSPVEIAANCVMDNCPGCSKCFTAINDIYWED
jgi:hypothetical protein